MLKRSGIPPPLIGLIIGGCIGGLLLVVLRWRLLAQAKADAEKDLTP